jgi:hypothetical protein
MPFLPTCTALPKHSMNTWPCAPPSSTAYLKERELKATVDSAGIDLACSDADREERMRNYPGVKARVDTRTGEIVYGVGSSGVDLTLPPGEPPHGVPPAGLA